MPSITEIQASNATALDAAAAAPQKTLSAADRLKRMEEIIREVNKNLAPELRALQLLRQPNAKQLAKRYY